jgi:hypothetical protein
MKNKNQDPLERRLYWRLYMRKWRAKNRERDRAIKRRWYLKMRAKGLKLMWVREAKK